MRISTSAVAAFCVSMLTMLGAGLAAAEPTDAQRSAIEANCRSDFMSNCSGVPAGGAEAMQCLEQHLSKLSPGCQQAVKAVAAPAALSAAPAATTSESAPAQPAATETPPAAGTAKSEANPAEPKPAEPKPADSKSAAPAPANAPPIIGFIPPREKLMVMRSCRPDLAAHCAGVQPGENRELRCLLSNRSALTPDCKGALAKLSN